MQVLERNAVGRGGPGQGQQHARLLPLQHHAHHLQAVHPLHEKAYDPGTARQLHAKGDHAAAAEVAIKDLFEDAGKGRTGKLYEEDGKFYASGKQNENNDLLLGVDTEPSQKLRNGDIEEKFFPEF